MVRAGKVPSLAAGRWNTLNASCNGVSGFLLSLAAHYQPAWLKGLRDKKNTQRVATALATTTWYQQHLFVTWSCAWLGEIHQWVCGCPRNDIDDPDAENCQMQGRSLGGGVWFRRGAPEGG